MSVTPKQCVTLTHECLSGLVFDRIVVHEFSGAATLTFSGRTVLMLSPEGEVTFRPRNVPVH